MAMSCQVVDDRGLFKSHQLGEFIDGSNIGDKPVRVVSIIGAQSSGKSTLLNLLFGTQFDVMTSRTGPRQTTKGIWLARSKKLQTVLVMDVEGTDSVERGATALDFERKCALFSLALSEVVLVNLWSHDIGRSNAANLPLLKMVFEVNLQVFQESGAPKTVLLFVIRDHVSRTTSLEVLSERILKDMRDIWAEIPRPQHWQDCDISDVFDFAFHSLAHFSLEPDNFEENALGLAKRFFEPSNSSYLFRRAHPKTVPADGFAAYATGIWDTILENRNLDLPNQKQILSLQRCSDFLQQAYNLFMDYWRPMLANLENGRQVPQFEKECSRLVAKAYGFYDMVASGYHPEVVANKRHELRDVMVNDIKSNIDIRTRQLGDAMNARFTEVYEEDVAGELLADKAQRAKDAALAIFPSSADLDPSQIDPDVAGAILQPYNEVRREFLSQVDVKTMRLQLDDASRHINTLQNEIKGVRDDYESEISILRRQLEDSLELSQKYSQASESAQAEVRRVREEQQTEKNIFEAESQALRTELKAMTQRLSEYDESYETMKNQHARSQERQQSLEGKLTVLTSTVTSQAEAIVALRGENEHAVAMEREKQVDLEKEVDSLRATVTTLEGDLTQAKSECANLRARVELGETNYGENTMSPVDRLAIKKKMDELDIVKRDLSAMQHENQYLTQLLNERQHKFHEEYQRSLHERHLLAEQLDQFVDRGHPPPRSSRQYYPPPGAVPVEPTSTGSSRSVPPPLPGGNNTDYYSDNKPMSARGQERPARVMSPTERNTPEPEEAAEGYERRRIRRSDRDRGSGGGRR